MREFLRARSSSNAYVIGVTLLWLAKGDRWWAAGVAAFVGCVLLVYGLWVDVAGWWARRRVGR